MKYLFRCLYAAKMTYKVEIDKKVRKYLDKQSDQYVRKFYEKIQLLRKDPLTPYIDTKKLI